MSKPRDYRIEIRDAGQEYLNEAHRFYANIGSTEAAGETGTIKLRINRGEELVLTPFEAHHIGRALLDVAQGALHRLTAKFTYENLVTGETVTREHNN